MAIIQAPGGTGELAQNLLRFFMQREELEQRKEAQKLQERQVKLREEEAGREAEQQAAAQQAAQATLGLLAQNDPEASSLLAQMVPGARSAAPFTPNAVTQPTLGQGPGLSGQTAQPVPTQFDPSQVSGAQAQALVGQIQGLRESQSRVQASEAATEASRVQTRAATQAIEHRDALFTDELRQLRASTRQAETGADLNEARIAALQREEARTVREFAANRATDQQRIFAQLAPILGPGESSRVVFGTSAPPSREELIAQEAQFITQATAFADAAEDPEAALTRLHEDRQRTQIAQRLGIPAQTQQALDAAVERSEGDPQAAYEFAKEATSAPGSIITEADLPLVASYLALRFPGFEIPQAERGFLRNLLDSLSVPPEPSGSGVIRTPEGERQFGGAM